MKRSQIFEFLVVLNAAVLAVLIVSLLMHFLRGVV